MYIHILQRTVCLHYYYFLIDLQMFNQNVITVLSEDITDLSMVAGLLQSFSPLKPMPASLCLSA